MPNSIRSLVCMADTQSLDPWFCQLQSWKYTLSVFVTGLSSSAAYRKQLITQRQTAQCAPVCSHTAYVALTPGSGWYTGGCSVTTWAGRCRTGAVETWWKVVSQWVHSHYRCHHAGSQSCDTKAHPMERAIKVSGHKVKLQCVTTNKTCTCTVDTVHVQEVGICQHLPFIFFAVDAAVVSHKVIAIKEG